ncbi:MAG: hypothetical protein QM737_12180 [Ferruginibacter sp.]
MNISNRKTFRISISTCIRRIFWLRSRRRRDCPDAKRIGIKASKSSAGAGAQPAGCGGKPTDIKRVCD